MWTIMVLFGAFGVAIAMFVSDVNAGNEATVMRSNCVNGGGKWTCKHPDEPLSCYCITPGKPKSNERPPR
jgi:hypothetical protein